ncbi:hypothetical protein [Demequina iriomotensis]|uniref:hypothetical protein n=1 Tax=Demequina iriomotensis TaxID=1536641 RepID=UPI000782265D|nr:hypothetical protein [Demequina iriomotensis]
MSELRDILHQRHHEMAASLRDAPEFDEAAATRAVRTHRRGRVVVMSSSSLAAAAVIASGTWLLLAPADPVVAPAWTPSPSPSVSVSPTSPASPAPEPSASPSGTAESEADPSVPLVTGDDVAVLERLMNPTTGETWHEPVEVDVPAGVEATDHRIYLEVGARADAAIVAAVTTYDSFYTTEGFQVVALLEVDGSGTRQIVCPSTRADDMCVGDTEIAGAAEDRETHYDSLTYPRSVTPAAAWTIATGTLDPSTHGGTALGWASLAAGAYAVLPDGTASTSVRTDQTRTEIAELGGSTLVALETPGEVEGTVEVHYAIDTPLGTRVQVGPATAGYGAGAVTWTDGVDTFAHPDGWGVDGVARPNEPCWGGHEMLDAAHDASRWTLAGESSAGTDVYVPADSSNELARRIFEFERDRSYGELVDPIYVYPYETFQEFLDTRSLFTWQRGDGAWVLGIDSFAGMRYYECV